MVPWVSPSAAQSPPPPAAILLDPDVGRINPPNDRPPGRPASPFDPPPGRPASPFDPPLGVRTPFDRLVPGGSPPPAASRNEQDNFGTLVGLGLVIARGGRPGYGVTWYPEQSVGGQHADLGIVRQELAISSPILTEGPDTAAVLFSLRHSLFYTDAMLQNSGRKFPGSLWNISAGVAYSHRFDNDWTGGVVINGGSASDRPFTQSRVLNASVTGYLAVPAYRRDYWIFAILYSPTADFPYPIPGVAYAWRPNQDLTVNIGIPFLLNWRIYDDFTVNLFYVPIRNVRAVADWEYLDGWHVYGGFEWMNESWFLADRENPGDRFFSYEKRLFGGMRIELPYRLQLDIAAGYSFDRFFFQGRRYADRAIDQVNVEPGVFGTAQLRIRF